MKIGSNTFESVPVPLVVGRRYFIVNSEDPMVLSVLFDDPNGVPHWEIDHNQPGSSAPNVTRSGAGVVTVADPASKQMLYKIRPDSETSIVFGRFNAGKLNVRISDRHIEIDTNRFERNSVSGFAAGIVVTEEGDIQLGAPIPDRLNRALFVSRLYGE